ncbi:DUF4124 domain-containing protein [Marinobacter salinisoli]|uniref:DUF4124 domain-containing protein n=1 Tax=Marinobacter salinisoli TaxID=2769486 RepID=A0ABX7MUB9_9GAMM|nr:DUF4124 domain-containing protein [Marinobacter salinisoli]QSP94979.1 DUF4124 domain-containing protein [Marinobacter salinisoli]
MPRILAPLVLVGVCCAQAHGEVYTWKDSEGVAHFSDRPPEQASHQQVRIRRPSTVSMSDNLGQQRRVSGIREQVRELLAAPSRSTPAGSPEFADHRGERQRRCDGYRTRLARIQSQLRAGYSSKKGNTLRRQRRELSQNISRECMLR